MPTTPDTAKLVPVTAAEPIEADAPRVEVRSQDELAEAVRDRLVPVVAARDYFSVAGGVLVEVRSRAVVAATGDARVLVFDQSDVTAADDAYVEARDRSLVTLFGRARARMFDQSSGKSRATSRPGAFHDGQVRRSTDVRVWLYDDAQLESFAPGLVEAGDHSHLILHGNRWQSRAEVSGTASVSLDGAAEVVASGRSFVHLTSGRVSASGQAIVTSDYQDGEPLTIRASEQAVVVTDPGLDVEGPRLLTREQGLEIDTWLDLWGLQPEDGSVQLYVPVKVTTDQVFAKGWWNKPPLVVGAPVPIGLPVMAVPALRGARGQDALALRTVRVPVTALHPSSDLSSYGRASADEGVVVG
jgi:hypothetical protein